MDLKETIKGLREEIKFEKENNPNNLNEIGWGMQKGILISVNDLEKILDLCEDNQANSENANRDIFDVSGSLPSDPMVLAKYLHDNYEQIAKRTNWQTQKNCKVEFKDLPIENKNTMILLAGKLILDFVGNER